ncbi:hypothetical protein CDAR_44901 [Caerostris darwini]|uniref:Ycf2 n=1 Tax=Caerostris darwini TaxID=1538125 RepID=A0AAV4WQ94_9ARAC|nr:hypothetical protein CDAR_44901 [Caerostris darwini]
MHIWDKISNIKFEDNLSNLLETRALNLHSREIKCIGQSNQLTQMRDCSETQIDDAQFLQNLDTNLNTFILQNRAFDSSTKEFRPLLGRPLFDYL